jgi:glycosyltransferase involved in cell wall biosynthesis
LQRLLFVTERFPPDMGGLAASAGRIAAALSQLGIAVDVLTWSRFLQPGKVLPPESSGAKTTSEPAIYRIGLYRHWDMTLPHTLNLLDWLHQRHPYDAIWGHYLFPSGFLATWFAQMQSIPSVVSVRGNDFDRALFPPGDFARLQWTLESASLITTVSQDLARKVEVLSRRSEGVVTLPNAVDSEVFTAGDATENNKLRQALGIAPESVVLGFSGELREKKGQRFLLEALSRVQRDRPTHLLIIGEVRPSDEVTLQSFRAQDPVAAERIIITGHLANPTDVARHLRLCDVFLQPSLWEGMPNALLEAMACGCCCIASDAGGIPEVMTHQQNGFVVPRSQLHRLGEAVLECLDLGVAERLRVGMAARELVRSHFSLAQEQQNLQKIITKLGINVGTI